MQKFSFPPTMVGALTQFYIKNGGTKIRLHKTLPILILSVVRIHRDWAHCRKHTVTYERLQKKICEIVAIE